METLKFARGLNAKGYYVPKGSSWMDNRSYAQEGDRLIIITRKGWIDYEILLRDEKN